MLGKETIGHDDLERFHIGDRPRSLVGRYRRRQCERGFDDA